MAGTVGLLSLFVPPSMLATLLWVSVLTSLGLFASCFLWLGPGASNAPAPGNALPNHSDQGLQLVGEVLPTWSNHIGIVKQQAEDATLQLTDSFSNVLDQFEQAGIGVPLGGAAGLLPRGRRKPEIADRSRRRRKRLLEGEPPRAPSNRRLRQGSALGWRWSLACQCDDS